MSLMFSFFFSEMHWETFSQSGLTRTESISWHSSPGPSPTYTFHQAWYCTDAQSMLTEQKTNRVTKHWGGQPGLPKWNSQEPKEDLQTAKKINYKPPVPAESNQLALTIVTASKTSKRENMVVDICDLLEFSPVGATTVSLQTLPKHPLGHKQLLLVIIGLHLGAETSDSPT